MNIVDYQVINRNGKSVSLDFNKILLRLNTLKKINPELLVNVGLIAQNTIKLMANNITTIELDNIYLSSLEMMNGVAISSMIRPRHLL